MTPVPINGLNETIEGYDKISLSAGRAQGISLPYQPDTGITTEEGDPVGNNVTADDSIRKALNVGINRSEIVATTYSDMELQNILVLTQETICLEHFQQ